MPGTLLILAMSIPMIANEPTRAPWPFEPSDRAHFVANHHCAPLRLGETRGYIHGGIDLVKPAGTPVLAIEAGSLHVYREGAMDNAVLVDAEGNRWEYRHLAAESTPATVLAAIARGEEIPAGTVIGTVAPWGLGYAHLHLNRRRADGTIVDPLVELIEGEDTTAPVIERIAFLPAVGDIPLPRDENGALIVSGEVRLIVVAHDPSDRERFRHAPRRITAVLHRPTASARLEIADWHPYDGALPGPAGFPIPRYPRGRALDPYLRTGPFATENPIPRPGRQRFSIIATDTDHGTTWDSRRLPDGPSSLIVEVFDRAGLSSTRTVPIVVRNNTPPPLPPPIARDLEERLARVRFATAFEGDRVRATFDVPARWLAEEIFHLSRVTIIDREETAHGARITIEADTTGLRMNHTFEVRAGSRVDDTRRLVVEITPLFTLHSSTPRLTRGWETTFDLRIAIRAAAGLTTFHSARWKHGDEKGDLRITRHGLRTLGALISTVALQVPPEALGGSLDLEIEIAGRRRSLTIEIPSAPTGTAL